MTLRLRHSKPETKEEQRGEANRDGLLYRIQRYIDRKRKREKGVARERDRSLGPIKNF